MSYKFRDVVGSLDYHELKKMERDLNDGGIHLKNFVKEQLKEREQKHESICVTCQATLEPTQAKTYTLLFGPSDFIKKASFCGIDCLTHFLLELEHKKRF